MSQKSAWGEVIVNSLKFLGFRNVHLDMERLGNHYLAFGIFTSWIAGIGRYWDNPRASLWQHLGLGSVMYIFVLGLLLWLLIKPLRPANWTYKNVVAFIGLTALPGWLYAIPVERFMSMGQAGMVNVWFLGIVALWRVILLVLYLKRSSQLSAGVIVVASLLPLALIVFILTMLNLEHVVFNIMGGIREESISANDAAYSILLLITYLSVLGSPILLVMYFLAILAARTKQDAIALENNGEGNS